MLAASAGSTNRFDLAKKLKPIASTPVRTTIAASASLVTPQILVLNIEQWLQRLFEKTRLGEPVLFFNATRSGATRLVGK